MSVCVCPHKPFVHDSDHNFYPIFLIFGTWVRHVITNTKFDGQVPRVNGPPFKPPKSHFGESLQLKLMESISASFLTTDKAIITKTDQNIKQTELYFYILDPLDISVTAKATNFKFGLQLDYKEYYQKYKILRQKGHGLGHMIYF